MGFGVLSEPKQKGGGANGRKERWLKTVIQPNLPGEQLMTFGFVCCVLLCVIGALLRQRDERAMEEESVFCGRRPNLL